MPVARRITLVPAPPWYFELGRQLACRGTRGAIRFLSALQSAGLLDKAARFPLANGRSMYVPLRWKWMWNQGSLAAYEPHTLQAFADAINATATGDAALVDCGADIGLVPSVVVPISPSIRRVIAFEPNPDVEAVLRANLEALPVPSEVHTEAVSNFAGQARLQCPDYSDEAHARFIVPAPGGPIRVISIDSLRLPETLGIALKIDVEGAELDVLKGAAETLARAPFIVVLFEAHRQVAERTGVDPIECVRFLNGIRPVSCAITSLKGQAIALDRPFFDQVAGALVRNVVVTSPHVSSTSRP